MRRAGCWAVALLVIWGCQRDSKNPIGTVDSESHWMTPCQSSDQCGDLECICGICSVGCDGQRCGALGGQCSAAPLCASAPVQVCVSACGAGCEGDHLECVAGACLPTMSGGDAGPDMPMDVGVDMSGVMDMSVPDGALPDMPTPDMPTPDMPPPDMPPPDMGDMDVPDEMVPLPVGECGHPDSVCQADVTCGDGRACSALFPNDPCVCVQPPAAPTVVADCEATGCCPGACGDALCQAIGHDAQDARCAGIPRPVDNACVAQACTHDDDCGIGRTCIRPGEWGHVRSACVLARCQQDADCDAEAGGACLGFFTPCAARGFACAYPSDPCRVDLDCDQRGGARVCLPLEGGGTECVPQP